MLPILPSFRRSLRQLVPRMTTTSSSGRASRKQPCVEVGLEATQGTAKSVDTPIGIMPAHGAIDLPKVLPKSRWMSCFPSMSMVGLLKWRISRRTTIRSSAIVFRSNLPNVSPDWKSG